MNAKLSATFFIDPANDVQKSTCKQIINMNKDAYDYMVSKECPSWAMKGAWAQLSKTQRIIKHLARTKEFLGASQFTFEILPD